MGSEPDDGLTKGQLWLSLAIFIAFLAAILGWSLYAIHSISN